MSRIDPACFPVASTRDERVCPKCFDDADLVKRIRKKGERGRCSYCKRKSRYTVALSDISQFIAERIHKFYGTAVDQLPYIGREGGYQGPHWDTYELLFDEIGLQIGTLGHDALVHDLVGEIGDETWAEYDWTTLELDDSLLHSWAEFRQITTGSRRFFFHTHGGDDSHPDDRSVGSFLVEVAEFVDQLGLVKLTEPGTPYYRVRDQIDPPFEPTAEQLGPPPAQVCLQSNRMNPPGIPMFYGAEDKQTAIAEARANRPVVGQFETVRPLRVLDLADLPAVPGFFSKKSRNRRLGLSFFHRLAVEIAKPVDQTNRVNVDYIPTQILTEFLRDYPLQGGRIDGVRYGSAVYKGGVNVVLFADSSAVADHTDPHDDKIWLVLTDVS
jgi:hypothetical protein